MSYFGICVALGFSLMVVGIGIANWANARMLEEVNCELPPQEKMSPYLWYFAKSQRLWRLHRSLVPNSRMRRISGIGLGLGIVGFLMIGSQFMLTAAAAPAR
jgi:hypothetical protein